MARRQASEQNFTSFQVLAQRRRQVIGLPQAAHGLLGREALLPRKPEAGDFIGNALVDLFLQSRNWPFGSAVAVALVVITLTTVSIYMRFAGRIGGARNVSLV